MILIDSNVLIDYLEGKEEIRQYIDRIDIPAFISVTSITELLAKPSLTRIQETMIENFLRQFSVLEYNEAIAREAAIIAATARIHKLTLISRDKNFRKIREIEIFDPIKISPEN